VGCLPGLAVRTKSKLLTTAHTHFSRYSAPKREQGLRLRAIEGDLGTWLGFGLGVEASTYGSTIALEETVLNPRWPVTLGELNT
jgi:hypothetical protein